MSNPHLISQSESALKPELNYDDRFLEYILKYYIIKRYLIHQSIFFHSDGSHLTELYLKSL